MSCLPGGLGCVSSRVGVHRHAVAACIVGLMVLLAGCSNSPTLVQVRCKDYGKGGAVIDDERYYAFETWYWSDGTRTTRPLKWTC